MICGHSSAPLTRAPSTFAAVLGLPRQFYEKDPQVVYREWHARQRVGPGAQRVDPPRKRLASAATQTTEDRSEEAPPLKRRGLTEERREPP